MPEPHDIQHHYIQYNNTQHNDIQHKNQYNSTFSMISILLCRVSFMLSIAKNTSMLSVVNAEYH